MVTPRLFSDEFRWIALISINPFPGRVW